MKYTTVEDAVASLPHRILPSGQEDTDYHTINSIHKLLQKNARSIDSHMRGGDLGHLGIIVFPWCM